MHPLYMLVDKRIRAHIFAVIFLNLDGKFLSFHPGRSTPMVIRMSFSASPVGKQKSCVFCFPALLPHLMGHVFQVVFVASMCKDIYDMLQIVMCSLAQLMRLPVCTSMHAFTCTLAAFYFFLSKKWLDTYLQL